jgi:2-enoate reductase
VGRLEIPELAERVIAEGNADMVALGRGLLSDAFWPMKTAEGKTEEIRPCIGCHDGCIGRFMRGKPLSCAVNPACGRERLYQLNHVSLKKKILVIGGGVAGMEAARTAALRGNGVIIFEKEKHLGGHLIEGSVPDFKNDLKKLLQWYEVQLKNLCITTKLGIAASEAVIARESPDVVIVATGSQPIIPDFPGIKTANVLTCIEALLGKKKTGKTIIVVGGGLVGCETALWLAKQGKEVIIIEILPELMIGGIPVPAMNRQMLLDLLTLYRVNILTNACIQRISKETVMVTSKNTTRELIADTLVLACGLKAQDEFYHAIAGKFTHIYSIGDCQKPRNIMAAIWDGYEVGRLV